MGVATTLAINNMTYNQALEVLVSAQDSSQQNAVRSFLNGPQLTYFGLAELHRELADGQSAVLFRENHFSVVYKHRGQLYTLVTAEGYLEARGLVWERLAEVEGESDFFSGDFQRYTGESAAAPVATGTAVPSNVVESDAALAQRLHGEEVRTQNAQNRLPAHSGQRTRAQNQQTQNAQSTPQATDCGCCVMM